MEAEQELEWSKAQSIVVSLDLVVAAKHLLGFLAAIDRNRDLYEGLALERAIFRYKKCWLPLLAKQAEFDVLEGPLVVPLDCEWVWHCHRLNPTQYKADCEECYGRILDNFNVVSTVQVACPDQTKGIWRKLYPEEPFELDLNSPFHQSGCVSRANIQCNKDYDLVSAVKRQSTFFYQVSRPFMTNDIILKEAVARYKGFLHLIMKNKQRSPGQFCVPTYDIDLIWHAHQLHPVVYSKDTVAIYGKVLEHDDSDSDRTEGKKLDIGFMETTKQWEQAYGLRYWKAGAMYRGDVPSPLQLDPSPVVEARNKTFTKESQSMIQLPKKMLIEVLMEVVGVRGIPEEKREGLFVLFRKKGQNLHNTMQKLSISSKSCKKEVANFQCEPTEELLLQLISGSAEEIMGSTRISLADILNFEQKLTHDQWFELSPPSGTTTKKLISIRISLSSTPAIRAPYMLHMAPSYALFGSHTSVFDEAGSHVIGINMRHLGTGGKEAIGIMGSGTCILANSVGRGKGNRWSLMDSQWDFCPQDKPTKQGYLGELIGHRNVIMMSGKRLEYEHKYHIQEDERTIITAVEFSPQHPYGKAVALFNLKSHFLEITEDWFLLPGITSAYILYNIVKRETYLRTPKLDENEKCNAFKKEKEMNEGMTRAKNGEYTVKSGACTGGGGGCGGGCGGSCGGGRCGGSCGGGGGCGGSCGGGRHL